MLKGQKLVSDSLVVPFGSANTNRIQAVVDSIVDQRRLASNCIDISEKTHYLSIPVDCRILFSNSLSSNIGSLFIPKGDTIPALTPHFKLVIKAFSVISKSDMFQDQYACNSIISIYQKEANRFVYKGTLVYEIRENVRKDRKHIQNEYIPVIDEWKSRFSNDINAIILNISYRKQINSSNLIKVQSDFLKDMIISPEIAIGSGSYVVDGELIFSYPEPKSLFYRKGLLIRYRHEKRYQAIEYALSNNQLNYRLNDSFLFLGKLKTFWGLNCWHNDEYKNHGLWDIFLLNLSLSESIIYNPFYKKGIICGVGIVQDATYIYSERYKIAPFIVFQIGIKL